MNIGFLLSNSASRSPNRTALVTEEGNKTFLQLEKRCGKLSGALLGSGLKPGDRVALLFYNSAYLVEAYFAAVRIGLVATPVNFRLVGREMAHILKNSGAKALFYSPEFEDTLGDIFQDLETVELYITTEKSDTLPAQNYETFLLEGKWLPVSEQVKEDSPCQVMYTSGTTGLPKGAVITHGNVMWNLHNTIYGREDRAGQRSIIVGPLYHTAALNNHLTIQIALGGTSVLVRKFDPERLLKTIEKEGATTISGSPAMYNLLLRHPAANRYDTTSITKCTSGADKLPMETKKQLQIFFPNINGVYDVYGCTEASPCITILAAGDSLRKDGSVGRPLPFLHARVVGDQGQQLSAGKVGEIICRGPNVMKGYHDNPDATRKALRGGWLHTGDLARVDDEGFFYVVDRKKDMIVSGGENIYPREIEEVLYALPAVADVAVVGVPDPTWGERVRAFVQVEAGQNLTEEDVIEYCRKKLASYKKPKEVRFVKAIPRNPSGKALKKQLREM